MAKLLLPAILFVLMTLTACSDQATTADVTTVPAPQPEATQADETATEATEVAPLEPTVIPTSGTGTYHDHGASADIGTGACGNRDTHAG